jgi:hypothetical protein
MPTVETASRARDRPGRYAFTLTAFSSLVHSCDAARLEAVTDSCGRGHNPLHHLSGLIDLQQDADRIGSVEGGPDELHWSVPVD